VRRKLNDSFICAGTNDSLTQPIDEMLISRLASFVKIACNNKKALFYGGLFRRIQIGVEMNKSESKTEMVINKSYASLRKAALSVAVSLAVTSPLYAATMTRDTSAPVGDNENSQTAGPEGPVLLQDSALIEKLQRFDRERIPARVVHARGTGAFGEFVPTGDISDLTKAKVLALSQ